MKTLKCIKASDINYNYCFLEVSLGDNESPFMDIRISDEKEMSFVFYAHDKALELSQKLWELIYHKAKEFYLEEIRNEEISQNW